MANLTVQIIGDDDSFRAALARSQKEAQKFATNVNKTLSTSLRGSGVSVAASFGPLLTRTRQAQQRADELSRQLQETGKSAKTLGGGLGPLIGRAGAFGLAANAAYSASRALSDSLRTTGSEAFTTTGKLKNLGASLVSGDLLGGIRALSATPKTFEDLGISVNQARTKLEAFAAAGGKIKDLPDGLRQVFQSMQAVVAAQDAARNSAEALADSQARLGQVFRDSAGNAVLFKGAVDDLGGLRGPGLVDQINAALENARAGQQGAPPPKPIGPTAKNAAAQTIAQAQGDLPGLLKLQEAERERLQKALDLSTGNVKQRTDLNAQLATAKAAVISTTKTISETQKAQAKAASEARKQAREDLFSNILSGLELKVDRSALTKRLNDDLAALEGLRAGLRRQIKAGVDVASAQAQLVAVTGQIADKQAQIRQKAADALQAKQFRAIGLSATGGEIVPGTDNLKKQLASLTERLGPDITPKIKSQFEGVSKVLSGSLGKVTLETRSKIKELFAAVRQEFDKQSTSGPLTKTRNLLSSLDLSGLNLSERDLKELQGRLSSFNTNGVALAGAGVQRSSPTAPISFPPIVVQSNTTVELDGDVVARSTTRHQQKRASSSSSSTRGRFGGIGTGLA